MTKTTRAMVYGKGMNLDVLEVSVGVIVELFPEVLMLVLLLVLLLLLVLVLVAQTPLTAVVSPGQEVPQ